MAPCWTTEAAGNDPPLYREKYAAAAHSRAKTKLQEKNLVSTLSTRGTSNMWLGSQG